MRYTLKVYLDRRDHWENRPWLTAESSDFAALLSIVERQFPTWPWRITESEPVYRVVSEFAGVA